MILAFSLQSEINKIGAYAGFAAIIGLALLVLLYFAQARELRRLNDWIEQQPDRARLSPAAAAPPAAAARPTAVSSGAAAAGSITTAVPGVRRVAVGPPGAVPGVPAATAAGAMAATPAGMPAKAPVAPATAAGSDPTRVTAATSEPPEHEEDATSVDAAEADTTRRAPTPARAGAVPWGAAAVPLAAGPAATAEPVGAQSPEGGAGDGDKEKDEYAPDTAETAAAAALPPSGAAVVSLPPVVGTPSASPKAEPPTSKVTPLRPVPPPPAEGAAAPPETPAPAKPVPDDPPPLAPSTAAGARPRFPPAPAPAPALAPAPDLRTPPVGAAARVAGRGGQAANLDPGGTAPTRRRERERERPMAQEEEDRRAGPPAATLRLIAAAIVIVVVLIFIATKVFGGSSPPTPRQTTSSTNTNVTGPSPSTVRVAVLNGTHTTGLASSVSTTLTSKGFRKGAVADAPSQNHSSTIVGYSSGNRAAAVEVASDLGLSSTVVGPADAATRAVAANSHSAAKVIVTLGSDFSQR